MLASLNKTDVIVAVLCLASVLLFLGARDIDGVRERRLAGSSADIDRNGSWLIPELLGEPRMLKPLLADWLAAASLRVLGRSTWAFRLPFALAGLGIIGLSWALARGLLGATAGRTAAVMLAVSPWFIAECHSASTDLFLTLNSTAAMLSWWRWQQTGKPYSGPWWGFWLSVGLGCMAKGPVALALAGIPVTLELWASSRWKLGLLLRPWWGMLIVCGLALPWPVEVWLHMPEAPHRWLDNMNESFTNRAGRASSAVSHFSHLGNWLWLSFPWCVPGAASLALVLWRRRFTQWPRLRFLYFWITGNLAMLCLWSKQPMHYLMPLIVPCAIIGAALILHVMELIEKGCATKKTIWAARAAVLSSAGCGIAAAVMMSHRADASAAACCMAGAALTVPVAVALDRVLVHPRQALLLCAVSAYFTVMLFSGWINPRYSRTQSIAQFAEEVAACVPLQSPVYFTDIREAVPFYVQRDFKKIENATDLHAVLRQLQGPGSGYLMLLRTRYEMLAAGCALPVDLKLLAQSRSRHDPSTELVLVWFAARQQ